MTPSTLQSSSYPTKNTYIFIHKFIPSSKNYSYWIQPKSKTKKYLPWEFWTFSNWKHLDPQLPLLAYPWRLRYNKFHNVQGCHTDHQCKVKSLLSLLIDSTVLFFRLGQFLELSPISNLLKLNRHLISDYNHDPIRGVRHKYMQVVVLPNPGLIKTLLLIDSVSTDVQAYTYMFVVYASLESYLSWA